MTKNIGTLDRLLRLAVGTILLISAIILASPVLAIIGIFTIYEAISSWCIFYQLIGRNTCPLPNSDSARRIPIFKYYLTGLVILLTAIILNYLAGYLGWSTWYDVLTYPDSLTQISLDNWLFLLIFYPLTLAVTSMAISTKSTRPDQPRS